MKCCKNLIVALPPHYNKNYLTLLSLLRFSNIPPPARHVAPELPAPATSPRIPHFSKCFFRNTQTFSPRRPKTGASPKDVWDKPCNVRLNLLKESYLSHVYPKTKQLFEILYCARCTSCTPPPPAPAPPK